MRAFNAENALAGEEMIDYMSDNLEGDEIISWIGSPWLAKRTVSKSLARSRTPAKQTLELAGSLCDARGYQSVNFGFMG
jgi:hypothetical protein